MPRLAIAALVLCCLAAGAALPADARAASNVKVAVIVGPVGSLTPTYLHLAERAAATAEARGARVARAYSPNATPAAVLSAVADAHVVIYFGHGYGNPSPYGGLNRAKQNGWALQGPNARGTHADSWTDGRLAYYGEDWIVANARPAPGFVMIYSNTCYAPGASEGGDPPASARAAAERVSGYSRPIFALGGSAYFATDFDYGAADLVDRLLASPRANYASAFVSDHRYVPSALTTQAHWFSSGQQVWLHRSVYSGAKPNYWYAFAGNPDATPARSWDRTAPTLTLDPTPPAGVAPTGVLTLRAGERIVGASAQTVRLLDERDAAIAATVQVSADGRTLTVRPAAPLPVGARLRLVTGSGMTDPAGNPVAGKTWTFTTIRDADPGAASAIVLEPGDHELVRIDPIGAVAERATISVDEPTGARVRERSRLVGLEGSWFALASGEHAGWWVAESATAHAIGLVEEVAFAPAGRVALAPGMSLLDAPAGRTAAGPAARMSDVASEVTVDRRAIIDGRGYARVADGPLAGRWMPVAASYVPEGSQVVRVSPIRAEAGSLDLAPGTHELDRFDAAGRVTARAVLDVSADRTMGYDATMLVAGRTFVRPSDGEWAGWWIAASHQVNLVPDALVEPVNT